MLDLGNCNNVTGECYNCLNHTIGEQCEWCQNGFYGDAVEKKNCRDCSCSLCGSTVEPCNNITGHCRCKNNVEGDKCSRCKVGDPLINLTNNCMDTLIVMYIYSFFCFGKTRFFKNLTTELVLFLNCSSLIGSLFVSKTAFCLNLFILRLNWNCCLKVKRSRNRNVKKVVLSFNP